MITEHHNSFLSAFDPHFSLFFNDSNKTIIFTNHFYGKTFKNVLGISYLVPFKMAIHF